MNGDLLFQFINSFALKNFYLDTAGIFSAYYLPYCLVVFLFLFLLFDFKKFSKLVFASLISATLAVLIVLVLRLFFFMPRPFVLRNVNLLLSHSAGASFPSLHAAFFFGLSYLLFFKQKKIGTLFLVLSFLVGIARIFCGLHWTSDIAAGIIVGIVSAFFVKEIFYRQVKKNT